MRIVSVFVWLADIGKGNNIQLCLASSTSSVHRKEDWPCNASSPEAQNGHQLQESQVQITIERLVIENVFILEVFEMVHPAEFAVR